MVAEAGSDKSTQARLDTPSMTSVMGAMVEHHASTLQMSIAGTRMEDLAAGVEVAVEEEGEEVIQVKKKKVIQVKKKERRKILVKINQCSKMECVSDNGS